MHINSFNNNSPKFKSLQIHDNVRPLIEKESDEFVQSLSDLGERVKDFKHYNVVLKDNLVPKIYSANANVNTNYDHYKRLLNEEKMLGRYYQRGDEYESYGGYHPDQPYYFINIYGRKEAVEKYNEFKKLGAHDRVVEFCRMLNEQQEKRIAKEEALKTEEEAKLAKEQAEKDAFEKKVNTLFEDFGYIEPVSANTESTKTGFFGKIKNIFKK